MATKVEPFYRAFGEQIRRVREGSKLSQAELAEQLLPPVTRASVANMENAKQRVLVHTLIDIARVLRVDVAELLPPMPLKSVVTRTLSPGVAAELARELGAENGAALLAKLEVSSRVRPIS
jgi:transcriptional regulator with XRE-family HTH domain